MTDDMGASDPSDAAFEQADMRRGCPWLALVTAAALIAALAVAAVVCLFVALLVGVLAYREYEPDASVYAIPSYIPEGYELEEVREGKYPGITAGFAVYGKWSDDHGAIDASIEAAAERSDGSYLWDSLMTLASNPCCDTADIGGIEAILPPPLGVPTGTIPILWTTPQGDKVFVVGRNVPKDDVVRAARALDLGDGKAAPVVDDAALPDGFERLTGAAPLIELDRASRSVVLSFRRSEPMASGGTRDSFIHVRSAEDTPYLQQSSEIPWWGGRVSNVRGSPAILREWPDPRPDSLTWSMSGRTMVYVSATELSEDETLAVAESVRLVDRAAWDAYSGGASKKGRLEQAVHQGWPCVMPALPSESADAWLRRAQVHAQHLCRTQQLTELTIELPDHQADIAGFEPIRDLPHRERTFVCEGSEPTETP